MKIGTFYNIPSPLYWAFKRQCREWEQPVSKVLTQAVDEFILAKGLKDIPYYKENPEELSSLVKKTLLRPKSSLSKDVKGFSTTPKIGLTLHILSLQLKTTKVDVLIKVITNFLNGVGASITSDPILNTDSLTLMELVKEHEKVPTEMELELESLEENKFYSEDNLKVMSKQLKKVQNLMKEGGYTND